jgi:hypothetical protein
LKAKDKFTLPEYLCLDQLEQFQDHIEQDALVSQEGKYVYELEAAVTHIGSGMGAGHYNHFAKKLNRQGVKTWY